MTLIDKVRTDDVNFDLVINDDMPEMFVDGISSILMGNPISKLTFHSVRDPANPENNEIEQRKGVFLLTISTPVLLEICRSILSAAQSSIDDLSDGGKKFDTQVRKIMEGVDIVKPHAD